MDIGSLRRSTRAIWIGAERMSAVLELREMIASAGDRTAGEEILLTLMNDKAGEVVVGTAFACAGLSGEAVDRFRDQTLETFQQAGSRSTSEGAPLLRLAYVAALAGDQATLRRMAALRPGDLGVDRVGRLAEYVAADDSAGVLPSWRGARGWTGNSIARTSPCSTTMGDAASSISSRRPSIRCGCTGRYDVPLEEPRQSKPTPAVPEVEAGSSAVAPSRGHSPRPRLAGLIRASGARLGLLIRAAEGAAGQEAAPPDATPSTEPPTAPAPDPKAEPTFRLSMEESPAGAPDETKRAPRELAQRAARRRWEEPDLAGDRAVGSRKCDLCPEAISADGGFLFEPAPPGREGRTPPQPEGELATLSEAVAQIARSASMTRRECLQCGLSLSHGFSGMSGMIHGMNLIQRRPGRRGGAVHRGAQALRRAGDARAVEPGAVRHELDRPVRAPRMPAVQGRPLPRLPKAPPRPRWLRDLFDGPDGGAADPLWILLRPAGPGLSDAARLAAIWAGRPELADPTPASLPLLLKSLGEPPEDVAASARAALGHIADPDAIDTLCQRWADQRDETLREVIRAAGYVARRPISTRVRTALLHDAPLAKLAGDQEELAPIEDDGPQQAEALLDVADGPDSELAGRAARLLAEHPSPSIRAALFDAAFSGQGATARAWRRERGLVPDQPARAHCCISSPATGPPTGRPTRKANDSAP